MNKYKIPDIAVKNFEHFKRLAIIGMQHEAENFSKALEEFSSHLKRPCEYSDINSEELNLENASDKKSKTKKE